MIKKIVLPNKITIIMEKLSFVRSVSFGIWVKNGSRNESEKINGISHFIEHMFFKGTYKRNKREIAYIIDLLGGNVNAFTSKEYTCYYFKILDINFDTAIELISDMFFNSKFDTEEIDRERKVIIEEINMYEDTAEDLVNDLLQANVWKNNSLGLPILGTEKSISTFDRKIFENYLKKNYCGDNIVISIAGNINDNIINKVEKYFGYVNNSCKNEKNNEARYENCLVTKYKDIEQINFVLGFEGIKSGIYETYIMSVFNIIFGGGMSSRLFQKIREEQGLAYSVYSYNCAYHDTGLFCIYAGINKNNLELTIKSIIDEIKRLKIDTITEDELKITKEQLKTSYLLSLESSYNRMNYIGRSQLMLNKILYEDEIIEIIDGITLEKIYSLINNIFDLEKISLSVVGNINNIKFKGILDNAR